jgi:hypothetical protein
MLRVVLAWGRFYWWFVLMTAAYLPLPTKGIVDLLFVNPGLSENYFEEIFAINREFGASV